ncbi:MAG: cobalamin biosynthesis protein CbiG, partial [Armatimonadetes bacterium]|nr:cobalamin biosynthesis protein CbiG [Armatimonadota bacterium]NIO95848.1 cobalamin biosynthesis protein CbiG [Armatimonadota bacterium]
IMAVGAAVRLLASELRNKREDPAVVVLDERGTFAVSLLSGHGGGNELANKVAHLLGAQPVVTTASEVSATIAVDLLGKEFGWELENSHNATAVAASLVNGEPVGIFQDAGERNWWRRDEPLPANVHIFADIESLGKSDCRAAIIITDRILNEETEMPSTAAVIYRPRSLVVGIGCNRGTSAVEIEKAVTSLFSEHHLAIRSIRNIATIDLKKNEAGLLEFARTYGLPVEYFNKDALSKVQFPSAPSPTVLKHVGTAAVCEAAAILGSRSPV